MRLGALVLQLRSNSADTFPIIGGAAEYAFAKEGTLTTEAAFILPLQESASRNQNDTIVHQRLTEQFAVVVALKNDLNMEDKTGFKAYNKIHNIRQEIFGSFLGLDIGRVYGSDRNYTSESLIYYRGGQLLDFDRAYLWYQFTFEYEAFIESQVSEEATDFLDSIWADYETLSSPNIPINEDLPIDLFAPDMQQFVNLKELREEQESHIFGRGFSLAFDIDN